MHVHVFILLHFVNLGNFLKGLKIEKILKADAKYLPYPNSRGGVNMYIKHGGLKRLMRDLKAIKAGTEDLQITDWEPDWVCMTLHV